MIPHGTAMALLTARDIATASNWTEPVRRIRIPGAWKMD
jgi:hypothetical protein